MAHTRENPMQQARLAQRRRHTMADCRMRSCGAPHTQLRPLRYCAFKHRCLGNIARAFHACVHFECRGVRPIRSNRCIPEHLDERGQRKAFQTAERLYAMQETVIGSLWQPQRRTFRALQYHLGCERKRHIGAQHEACTQRCVSAH